MVMFILYYLYTTIRYIMRKIFVLTTWFLSQSNEGNSDLENLLPQNPVISLFDKKLENDLISAIYHTV